MATLDDVQQQAYAAANSNAVYDPALAICKKWLTLKTQGILIGVPLGPEVALDDGTVAQAFTSGAILRWLGGDDVELV